MKTKKTAMIISAIAAIVLGIVCYVSYNNANLYTAAILLLETAIFAFTVLYMYVSSPDKKFA